MRSLFPSLLPAGLANYSLVYLNFTTQVIFKSSKVIPVMVVGALVWKKKYNFAQYGSALLLIVGLILFTLADRAVQPNFDAFGVILVCGSLTADAFIGNVQESVFKQGASQLEAMTWPSTFSAIIGTLLVVVNDDPVVTFK